MMVVLGHHVGDSLGDWVVLQCLSSTGVEEGISQQNEEHLFFVQI